MHGFKKSISPHPNTTNSKICNYICNYILNILWNLVSGNHDLNDADVSTQDNSDRSLESEDNSQLYFLENRIKHCAILRNTVFKYLVA